MRRQTKPATGRSDDTTLLPTMNTVTAKRLGGQYAVCMKFSKGNMICVGGPHPEPSGASAEIHSGLHNHIRLLEGQEIVVGICCRYARRWVEPRFIADPVNIVGPHP